MIKDPKIPTADQLRAVNPKQVKKTMSSSESSLSTHKGVFFTLAALFFYAILIQLTNGSVQTTSDVFQMLNVRTDIPDILHSHFSSRKLLQGDGKNNGSNTDPINPKNKICRDYLKKFIQGSTDSKDECQGLENAWKAADCSDDITNLISFPARDYDNEPAVSSSPSSDPQGNGDDTAPVIDDFFEEFQCCKVISHYHSARCLYHQQFASLSLLGIVAVLILCNLVKSLLTIYGIKWLPEAGGCILVGAIVGAILTMRLPDYQMNLGTFNDDLFLFILLPPIIFHASLSIDKTKFRMYIFPIMML